MSNVKACKGASNDDYINRCHVVEFGWRIVVFVLGGTGGLICAGSDLRVYAKSAVRRIYWANISFLKSHDYSPGVVGKPNLLVNYF
jgi:hypothetical protein